MSEEINGVVHKYCVPIEGEPVASYVVELLGEGGGWLTAEGISPRAEWAIRFMGAKGIEVLVKECKEMGIQVFLAPPEVMAAIKNKAVE